MFSLTLIVYPQFNLEEQVLLHSLVKEPFRMPSEPSMVLSWVSSVIDHDIRGDDEPVLSLTDGSNVKLMKMSVLA